MPQFKTPEEFVAYRVFKQTRTTGDVSVYEVVDRFTEGMGSKIVARFNDEAEADEYRDNIRLQRIDALKVSA